MNGDPALLANLRILVVEDESIVAMMLEEFLIDLGCIVVGSAARLGEALDLARSLEIDMAVLDLKVVRRGGVALGGYCGSAVPRPAARHAGRAGHSRRRNRFDRGRSSYRSRPEHGALRIGSRADAASA